MSMMSDEGLVQEFVTESREHLSTIEPDLLALEAQGENMDSDLINRVFRAIHSIKGAAGFFGFETLKNLSHVMESVLMKIRDRQMIATSGIVELQLAGVDILNQMLDDIHNSNAMECSDLIKKLEYVLENNGQVPDEGSAPKATSVDASSTETTTTTAAVTSPQAAFTLSPDPQAVTQAQTFGQRLNVITFDVATDLQGKNRTLKTVCDLLTTLGPILTSSHPPEAPLDGVSTVQVLHGSVLEEDLVALTVDIPQTQIVAWIPERPGQQNAEAPVESAHVKTDEKPKDSEPAKQPNSQATAEAAPTTEAAKKPTSNAEGSETIRVRVDLLNQLMDLAGEMVLSRNQLLRAVNRDSQANSTLSGIVQNIDLITSDLQEHIMQTRMQPVGSVFSKFPRVVRDLSRQLGKEIDLVMAGEDVELDKSILESLSDPLTHMIRNCCDHALEGPDEREGNGKNRKGRIDLKAYHEGGQINIAIIDDGRGIPVEKITQKAVQNGLITEADAKKMSYQEKLNIIFLPGLSTAETISDVSGRGVGMDVVRTNIEKIGGSISLDSTAGKGTKFILRLPLTLAIIPSLIVGVGGQRYAMPQINLVELVCVRAADIAKRIEKVGTAPVLRLRGKLLPLVHLAEVIGVQRKYKDPDSNQYVPERRNELAEIPTQEEALLGKKPPEVAEKRVHHQSDYNIMVLKVGENQFGLIVDELFDSEEIVVKPLSGYLKNCKCFAGATIMGDGRVAMILDTGGILSTANLSFTEIDAEERRRELEQASQSNGNQTQSILLFNNDDTEQFAIPLESVLRLEKFDLADIEHLGSREFINYQGKGLPLVRLEQCLPVRAMSGQLSEAYLIIPKEGNGSAGIVASKIVDTLEMSVNLDKSLFERRGVSGSAVINNHLTLFIEPVGILDAAGISRN